MCLAKEHSTVGLTSTGRELMCLTKGHNTVELSLIGHLTYRYIDGKYCDISICIDIYK